MINDIYEKMLDLIELAFDNTKLKSVKLIKDPIANVKF